MYVGDRFSAQTSAAIDVREADRKDSSALLPRRWNMSNVMYFMAVRSVADFSQTFSRVQCCFSLTGQIIDYNSRRVTEKYHSSEEAAEVSACSCNVFFAKT